MAGTLHAGRGGEIGNPCRNREYSVSAQIAVCGAATNAGIGVRIVRYAGDRAAASFTFDDDTDR
jgi:hypothetical protein